MIKTLEKNSALNYKFDNEMIQPIFDKYGNPAPETLEAIYEIENGLTEEVSFEELMSWANE